MSDSVFTIAQLETRIAELEAECIIHKKALQEICTWVDPAASDGENNVKDICRAIRAGQRR